MKRKITILAVSAAMLLAGALPALAANGTAPDTGCQVGANNQIVGEWQLLSEEEFAQLRYDNFEYASYEEALKAAGVTYAFCDRNNDGLACVMTQTLPNDASGSIIWTLVEDNHPFGGR
jgi:hypothetical protein